MVFQIDEEDARQILPFADRVVETGQRAFRIALPFALRNAMEQLVLHRAIGFHEDRFARGEGLVEIARGQPRLRADRRDRRAVQPHPARHLHRGVDQLVPALGLPVLEALAGIAAFLLLHARILPAPLDKVHLSDNLTIKIIRLEF